MRLGSLRSLHVDNHRLLSWRGSNRARRLLPLGVLFARLLTLFPVHEEALRHNLQADFTADL